jgi:hypothetical protein
MDFASIRLRTIEFPVLLAVSREKWNDFCDTIYGVLLPKILHIDAIYRI